MEGGGEGGGMRRDGGGRMGSSAYLDSSSPVSVHGPWPSFVSCGGCFGWWWFVCIVIRG